MRTPSFQTSFYQQSSRPNGHKQRSTRSHHREKIPPKFARAKERRGKIVKPIASEHSSKVLNPRQTMLANEAIAASSNVATVTAIFQRANKVQETPGLTKKTLSCDDQRMPSGHISPLGTR